MYLVPGVRRPKKRTLVYRDDFHMPANPMLLLEDYQHVADPKSPDHLINHLDREPEFTTFRGGWKEMKDVYEAAISNDEAKELIDLCGWDRLFTITVGNGDKKIVEGLIERWWDTTHTFHFPKLEIGFTPLDFTFLTGIPIGSGDPPPFDSEAFADYESMMSTYFPHMTPHIPEPKRQYRGNGINLTYVKEYILKSKARDTTDEGEEIARAFFMWMIGQVFFANSTCVVPIGWLAALLVIEDVGTYDWGSSILARIYRSLDECSRCAPYFSGMWMILEFWFYTYFQTLLPRLSTPSATPMDHWPLICAFDKSQRTKKQVDSGRHSFYSVRQQIELRSLDGTLWQPYLMSQYYNHPVVTVARHYSSQRVILWDSEHSAGYWYLGDRCWRQIHGEMVLAANPPARESMSNVTEADFIFYREIGWQSAERYIVRITDKKIYKQYWRHISRGAGLPPMRRGGNKEEVSVAAAQDPSYNLPYPPGGSSQMFTYPGPSDDIDTSQYCNWEMEVASSCGQNRTIPIISRAEETVYEPDMFNTRQWSKLAAAQTDLIHQLREMTVGETGELHRMLRDTQRDLRAATEELRNRERSGRDGSSSSSPQDYVPHSRAHGSSQVPHTYYAGSSSFPPTYFTASSPVTQTYFQQSPAAQSLHQPSPSTPPYVPQMARTPPSSELNRMLEAIQNDNNLGEWEYQDLGNP